MSGGVAIVFSGGFEIVLGSGIHRNTYHYMQRPRWATHRAVIKLLAAAHAGSNRFNYPQLFVLA